MIWVNNNYNLSPRLQFPSMPHATAAVHRRVVGWTVQHIRISHRSKEPDVELRVELERAGPRFELIELGDKGDEVGRPRPQSLDNANSLNVNAPPSAHPEHLYQVLDNLLTAFQKNEAVQYEPAKTYSLEPCSLFRFVFAPLSGVRMMCPSVVESTLATLCVCLEIIGDGYGPAGSEEQGPRFKASRYVFGKKNGGPLEYALGLNSIASNEGQVMQRSTGQVWSRLRTFEQGLYGMPTLCIGNYGLFNALSSFQQSAAHVKADSVGSRGMVFADLSSVLDFNPSAFIGQVKE
ncbi:hypothetical protein M413DRAFT_12036 [Hebeloma cylindrosporum]|uniref:Uncharacterized protein n=1 Tax=Hebeloma cylindrosporum TaxID=76867 RepID=A0A0C3C8U4_HEBCY|nr:hypothetical protein M413DRAFT_12036 [Hebeloma cylindrosporum h7]